MQRQWHAWCRGSAHGCVFSCDGGETPRHYPSPSCVEPALFPRAPVAGYFSTATVDRGEHGRTIHPLIRPQALPFWYCFLRDTTLWCGQREVQRFSFTVWGGFPVTFTEGGVAGWGQTFSFFFICGCPGSLHSACSTRRPPPPDAVSSWHSSCAPASACPQRTAAPGLCLTTISSERGR